MATRRRFGMVCGVGLCMVLLALSSTAYACTWYLGSVEANPSTGSASYAQGGVDQTHAEMGYCNAWGTAGNQVVGSFAANTSVTVTFTGAAATCVGKQATETTFACPWMVDGLSGHVCPTGPGITSEESWDVNYISGQWEVNYGHLNGADCMNTNGTNIATGLHSYSGTSNIGMSSSTPSAGTFSYTTPSVSMTAGTWSFCLTNSETYNDVPQVTFSVA